MEGVIISRFTEEESGRRNIGSKRTWKGVGLEYTKSGKVTRIPGRDSTRRKAI